MKEKRARDLVVGDKFREVGALDDEFHEVTYVEHRGDGVIVAVPTENGESDVDWPYLDGDEVVEVLQTFMVSFGSMYRTEPHPVLGFWPELADGVLTVEADSGADAREKVHAAIGPAWCALYREEEPPGWDAPDLGPLWAAVADPHPTSWTVGIQLTLNVDGTYELHMEDAAADLALEDAPPALTAQLDKLLDDFVPSVRWGKRP